MLEVNIFDKTCSHHVSDYGYFTSTDGRKPQNINFVLEKQEYDGITLFTDSLIADPIVQKVKSKIKIAWCLESPAIHPQIHNNIHLYADNFDYVLCYREDLIQKFPDKFLPNSPGGTYIKDEDINLYKKTKKCSMVLSNKCFCPGHLIRHQIQAASGIQSGIDFFGSGSPRGNLPINNKISALKNYMFHITIENVRSYHYFSEKLIDCLVTGCIPLYYGAPNIDKYFNIDGFILFNSFEEFLSLKLSKEVFFDKQKAIKENFELAQKYKSSDDFLATKLINL
jgi:hypothetical protein